MSTLISPSGNDAVARRRSDGTYSVGVSGTSFESKVAITRPSNTTAYAAGDVIGNTNSAIIEFTNIGAAGGYVFLQNAQLAIGLNSVTSGMGAFRLHLYSVAPTAISDNDAFNLVSGEVAGYAGYITLGAPQDLGSIIYSQTEYLGLMIKLAAGSTSLFGELQTINAYTPASGTTYDLRLMAMEAGS